LENPTIFPTVFSVSSPPYQLPYIQFLIEKNNNPRSMKNLLYFYGQKGMKVYLGKRGYGTMAVDINMLQPPLPWNGGYGGVTLIAGGTAVQSSRSIALQIIRDSPNVPVTYVHTSRVWPIPFIDEMVELQKSASNLRCFFFYTGKEV
jgi:hypothetical protein